MSNSQAFLTTGAKDYRRPAVVAGRECRACTVCCKVLPIHAEDFRKTANVLCTHCDEGGGCRVYQTRPNVCREFHCGWRMNPDVPATWRPDKSGIFIQRIPREYVEELAGDLSSGAAIMFLLLRPDAVDRPALTQLIRGCIFRRIATFLAVPGPAGYLPNHIFLNEAFGDVARTGDLQAMAVMLHKAMAALQRQEFERAPQ
jgi:hypothetical protein